jgi:hypothetical protein
MWHAVSETLAGMRVQPAMAARAIIERVWNFLVDRALAILELALDGERFLQSSALEDVDAPVLAR